MRRGKISFVALFIGLLLLPPLQMLFPMVDIPPLDEKRRLAPFPDIIGKYLHGDGRVSTAINEWFDDHVGFRPLLVRVKHQIDYSLFAYADKVLIGRDGWMYDPGFLDLVILNERGGEARAKRIEERFIALARFLAERQIHLVIVSTPMKETIYPQFLPRDAPRIPVNTMFQKLRSFLAERAEWIYIDGQGALPNCGDHQYFYMMDIHMTPQGPYCFAKLVVDRIAAAEHRDSPWHLQFTFTPTITYHGGLVDFLSLLSNPSAVSYRPSKMFDTEHPPAEGYFESDLPPGYNWIYRTREPYRDDKLPRSVLFGNSFSDFYLSAGMFLYFDDLYRGWGTGKELDLVLPSLPVGTRYFIYQFWEPLVGDLLMTKTLANPP
jgi:SGNH hydrolase-like domain, acetyltransferase AlgX